MQILLSFAALVVASSTLVTQRDWEAAASTATSAPRVWIDVGTSYRSLATWDVESNESLVVFGIDALQSNLNDHRQCKSPRFIPMQGACTTARESNLTFWVHASPTCGSLLQTPPNVPVLGSGSDACTGDQPRAMTVSTFRMSALLRRVFHLTGQKSIELLKMDVQGSELDCLRSAGHALSMVDNVLLEVQDVSNRSHLLLYKDSPRISDLDDTLAGVGFDRQYCEWNRWSKPLRELNCFYSSRRAGSKWLWATGNSQRSRSMVSYATRVPDFLDWVRQLNTSNFTGTRCCSQRMATQAHLAKRRTRT